MNLNHYDADLHVQRQKAMARAAAEGYAHNEHLLRRARPSAYRRSLIAAGGALIALGQRLQGELELVTSYERRVTSYE